LARRFEGSRILLLRVAPAVIPTNTSLTTPSSNRTIVGTDLIRTASARQASSSTLSSAKTAEHPKARANDVRTGFIRRQGPRHDAQKSMRTGVPFFASTTASKFEEESLTTLPGIRCLLWHRPLHRYEPLSPHKGAMVD